MSHDTAAAVRTLPFAAENFSHAPLGDSTASRPSDEPLIFGSASRLLNLAVVGAVAAPLCLPLPTPDWLRASLIGCAWGGLLLAGLGCSWSRCRLSSSLVALGFAGLAHRSLTLLTDLEHNACWLMVVCMLASGWCIGWFLTPWPSEHREPTRITEPSQAYKRMSRWSMWDIGGLATFVAAACWLVPRLEVQSDMLRHFAPALLSGMLVGLLAVEWVCRDCWSIWRLTAVALGLVGSGGLILQSAPAGLHGPLLLSWLLAGPASALGALSLTVLGTLAAARVDTHLASLGAAKVATATDAREVEPC